ncbi:solute carrier family 22 member 6-like [Liolophura sinensis]|uniref:solute carrier family 22 member 6-like n=1 Tax=Liolophura sinensis TaxID=3198878 RepID=UPI00315915E1
MLKASISQHIDGLFEALGVWGTYQVLQIIIVESLALSASHELFSILYIGYQPPVRCKGLENVSMTDDFNNLTDYGTFYKSCNDVVDVVNGSHVTGSCSRGYEYNQPKQATFVSEWDLVCGRSYQAQLPQMLLIGGQLFGASFFTSMADRFGRRKICFLSQLGLLLISVGTAFSPSLIVLATLRFFTGSFQQGVVMSFSVIPLEVMPTKNRALCFLIIGTFWPICLQVLNGIGYAFRFTSWRHMQLSISGVILLVFIPNLIFLKETLRWLFANGRTEDAKEIIKKAIRMNKAPETEVWEQATRCIAESERSWQRAQKETELSALGSPGTAVGLSLNGYGSEKPLSIIDIFKIPRLRCTALIMFFVWIVNALTHFGLVLTSAKLAGNRFINYILVSMDMLPASFIAYFILIRFGRKPACCSFHAIVGVCLVVAALVQGFGGQEFSTIVTVFTILGKFGNSASFVILFLYTPELYPTNLRSFGLGFASSASRLGGMLAPFSNLVMDYIPWAPGTVYGICSLLACLLIMLLPETLNRQLPQTVEEINAWNGPSICRRKTSESE